VLSDARERDSIGGQRVVAVVVTEPSPESPSGASGTTPPRSLSPSPLVAADSKSSRAARRTSEGGALLSPNASISSPSAPALVSFPRDQVGDAEASSLIVLVNVADGGALSPEAA